MAGSGWSRWSRRIRTAYSSNVFIYYRDIEDLKRQNGHLEAQIRALERAKASGEFNSANDVRIMFLIQGCPNSDLRKGPQSGSRQNCQTNFWNFEIWHSFITLAQNVNYYWNNWNLEGGVRPAKNLEFVNPAREQKHLGILVLIDVIMRSTLVSYSFLPDLWKQIPNCYDYKLETSRNWVANE